MEIMKAIRTLRKEGRKDQRVRKEEIDMKIRMGKEMRNEITDERAGQTQPAPA